MLKVVVVPVTGHPRAAVVAGEQYAWLMQNEQALFVLIDLTGLAASGVKRDGFHR